MEHSYTVEDMTGGPAWLIEDTPENRARIIAAICRRAFEEVKE